MKITTYKIIKKKNVSTNEKTYHLIPVSLILNTEALFPQAYAPPFRASAFS